MNTLRTCMSSTLRAQNDLSECKHPLVSLFLKQDLPPALGVDYIVEQILNNRNQIIERLDSDYYFHCGILTKKIHFLQTALAISVVTTLLTSGALAIKILTHDKI